VLRRGLDGFQIRLLILRLHSWCAGCAGDPRGGLLGLFHDLDGFVRDSVLLEHPELPGQRLLVRGSLGFPHGSRFHGGLGLFDILNRRLFRLRCLPPGAPGSRSLGRTSLPRPGGFLLGRIVRRGLCRPSPGRFPALRPGQVGVLRRSLLQIVEGELAVIALLATRPQKLRLVRNGDLGPVVVGGEVPFGNRTVRSRRLCRCALRPVGVADGLEELIEVVEEVLDALLGPVAFPAPHQRVSA
jgi:hypothetical protein